MDIPENSINEILENNPSQGTLYVLLTAIKEDGKYNRVIGECLKALSRFPEDLALRKILAEAYLGDGRLLEAEAEFNKVIKGMKTLAGVCKSQAEIYVRQKREDLAAESLKQYLVFFPEDEDAAILSGELEKTTGEAPPVEIPEEQVIESDVLEAGEPEEVDVMETQENEESPEIITASMAETYFDQGKLTEAREIYEKLVENDPEDMALKSRIDEISTLIEQKDEPEELEELQELQGEDTVRQKKEKVIAVLDSWRNNIRKLAEEGVTG